MKELRITITNEQAMLVEGLADKIEAGKKAGIELVVGESADRRDWQTIAHEIRDSLDFV